MNEISLKRVIANDKEKAKNSYLPCHDGVDGYADDVMYVSGKAELLPIPVPWSQICIDLLSM